jgi:hypothetical protein
VTTLDELEKLAGDALPHWGKNALPMLGGNPNAIDKTAPFVNAANPETILLLCRVARAAGGVLTAYSSEDYIKPADTLRTLLAEMGEMK